MSTDKYIQVLLGEIAKLRAENKALTEGLSAIGAIQFLIFRFLMQYDKKLAEKVAGSISKEIDKPLPPSFAGSQLYKSYIQALSDIASNPEQRDEKGRPTWIHLIKN